PQRLRLLRFHALRLRPLWDLAAALLGRAVRDGAPRLALGPASRRPPLLRWPRPRRHVHRERPLHPRAALRHARLDRAAQRLVLRRVRRRAPAPALDVSRAASCASRTMAT